MTLKAGTFRAKGMSAALGYTQGGKEQVAVELRIVEEEFLGDAITWYGYFTENTTERTLESLRLLGWAGDDLFDLSGIGSTEVRVVIKEEEYEGKLRLKAEWINPIGGLGLAKPMNDQQAKAFAARMKGSVLAMNKKQGTKPQSAPTSSGPRPQPRNSGGAYRDDEPPPPTDKDLGF